MNEKTKYILNVTYLRPNIDEDNNMSISPTMSRLGFEEQEKALEIFEIIKTEKMFEIAAEAGKGSYSVISIEFIDINKFDELNKNIEEVQLEEVEDGK